MSDIALMTCVAGYALGALIACTAGVHLSETFLDRERRRDRRRRRLTSKARDLMRRAKRIELRQRKEDRP